MRWWVVVVVAGAVGCSPLAQQPDASDNPGGEPDLGPDLNEGATSGTRLKLRYYDFGNVRQLVGVRDTQRNEDCNPSEWADGKAYCVPSTSGSTVYANATCTQRVGEAYVQPGCTRPPPAYFVDYSYSACDGKPAHLYPRGTKIAVTQYWYLGSDGSCNGPYTNTSSDYYALGPEIAVTDLATITTTSPSTTGRLGQRYYESADGLRYPLTYRLHDALLGGDCYPTSDAPGSATGSCVPSNTASTYYYRDAGCTLSQASVGATCPAPKFAAKYGACPYDATRYFAVTAKLTPTTVYYKSGMTCASTPASTYDSYYGVGGELTLAKTSRVRGTDAGRLQPIHFTTPEGLRNRDYNLFDSQIGSECYASTQGNGTIACIPSANSSQTYYTDAGCATPIELMMVYRGETTCSPPPLPSYAVKYTQTASCGYDYEVRHAGAAYTGPVFDKNGMTCTAFNNPNYLLYRVAAVVPLSELASGTLVTEP